MSKSKRHIHKYYRTDLQFTKVWRCALPDCNHYMPPHIAQLVEGRGSICWGCGEIFVLDGHNMKDDQPQCYDCKPIETSNSEGLAELLKQKGL